jgi:hypothetical protein
MQRRKFLALSGASAATLLSGCLGGGDDSKSGELAIPDDVEPTPIGESIEHGGLKVTLDDPVLFDHYAPYDCSAPQFYEDDDAIECQPPSPDNFEEPPTRGGQFMAMQLTIEHTGQRRINYPVSTDAFDLGNDGYAEKHHLFEAPWVAAGNVFPSWVFFVNQHDMADQGVFPGVSVRGYIAFEVPIKSDLNQYTGMVRWTGNAEEEQTSYWNITEDDVDNLTNREPPEIGGDVFYEPRAGGIDWGDNGHPQGEDFENDGGVRWEFDGDGESHVPEEQQEETETESS